MSLTFTDDIRWRANDLQAALCAVSRDRAALMVIRAGGQGVELATWIVNFDRLSDGQWVPEEENGQIVVHDTTRGGPWQQLDRIPDEVKVMLLDAPQRLTANTEKLIEIGAKRNSSHIREAIASGRESIRKRREFLVEHREGMARYAMTNLGMALDTIDPSPEVFHHQEIVEFAYGPLILSIKGTNAFTLSSAGIQLLDEEGIATRIEAEWKGDRWRGLPAHARAISKALEELKENILRDYRPQLRRAGIAHVANVLQEIKIASEALVRYDDLLHEREVLEDMIEATASTPSAPSP